MGCSYSSTSILERATSLWSGNARLYACVLLSRTPYTQHPRPIDNEGERREKKLRSSHRSTRIAARSLAYWRCWQWSLEGSLIFSLRCAGWARSHASPPRARTPAFGALTPIPLTRGRPPFNAPRVGKRDHHLITGSHGRRSSCRKRGFPWVVFLDVKIILLGGVVCIIFNE